MKGTTHNLRNMVLYEVYVRNHGPNGSFADVIQDLERIHNMGVDVIWLMPIHPIGRKNKKGTLGCPYSIADYRKVNPEYGSMDDFKTLVETAHRIGLKVMIDVVFNHTAHDSVLVRRNPDWFHQNNTGTPVTTVPAWSDVIDLKHPNSDLSSYLIDTLVFWVNHGVDGFRCDVASILPISFWQAAKKAVEALNPKVIWLAESVHTAFVIERRKAGLIAHADAELYQAFDLTYDYDIWPIWQAAVRGEVPVERYLEMLTVQKGIYPRGFLKMRCVENHDQPRIMSLARNRVSALAWTAFEMFNEGPFLLYAGQESGAVQTPSLFDRDEIKWEDYALQDWLTRLIRIKATPLYQQGSLSFLESDPAIQLVWQNGSTIHYGIFNVDGHNGLVKCQLPDGTYRDLINLDERRIINQQISLNGVTALIFELDGDMAFSPLKFKLLEFTIG